MSLSHKTPSRISTRTRAQRIATPAATIGGLALATAALRLHDPHTQYSWGICPSAAMGFWCPACGGLRAVNDLTNGDVGAAFSSNVVVVTLMPLAVIALGLWAIDSWRGSPATIPWQRVKRLLPAFLVLLVAFTVARNLAFGAWLAP